MKTRKDRGSSAQTGAGKVPRMGPRCFFVLLFLLLASPGFGEDGRNTGNSNTEKTYLYLLPVKDIPIELGPTWEKIHYGAEVADQLVKTVSLTWGAGGGPKMFLSLLAFEFAKAPPYIFFKSAVHLEFKYWLHMGRLDGIEKIPEVSKIHVISGHVFKLKTFLLAYKMENRALVLLETSLPLPQEIIDGTVNHAGSEWPEGWGRPILVSDPDAVKLRLALTINGEGRGDRMDVPIGDVLGKKPLPSEVAQNWRDEYYATPNHHYLISRLLLHKHDRESAIYVSLVREDGTEESLGKLVEGGAANKVLKVRWRDQLPGWATAQERALPIRQSSVLDSKEASCHEWWGWLTGRIIVTKKNVR